MCEHCGCGQPEAPPRTGGETIPVEQDVLAHNRSHADRLRERLGAIDGRLVNIIGGPGCGKTRLLGELIPLLSGEHPAVVVEGDLATDNDARRIAESGAPVHQVETGTSCHLSAHQVEHAIDHLPLERGGLVLVENVGNLVCPSMFDLGESLRIVCLSTTEGTDKPQKYPVSFREADLVAITKSDLIPHIDFDLDACLGMIRDIDPGLDVVVTSATDRGGLGDLAGRIRSLWEG
jgi:hydrogenase nickel incorporation protein HypB